MLCDDDALTDLGSCAGVFCTTGSPYRSLDGALAAIRHARTRATPFLGTCGGFQHAVVEYARNVAGLSQASHGEYGAAPEDQVISPLACSLVGQTFSVAIAPGTRVARCYEVDHAREHYYCSYGIDSAWMARLTRAGLSIVGTAGDGTPRILELPGHPFFVATLFVPQARSTGARPHPLIHGFVRACAARASG